MFVALKRHPIPVVAHFRRVLVLTYALPQYVLRPLLPPGLELDTFDDFGFVAVALVQTDRLRPAFLPGWMGQSFFLSGYRIFARFTTHSGRTLRGLRIVRSDTDKPLMGFFGNLLTHYNYQRANVSIQASAERLKIHIKTPGGVADLRVAADLTELPAKLPTSSPFRTLREARLFAGPLPFTFDYERESNSIILIEGVRKHWHPHPVGVRVFESTFFHHGPFAGTTPLLANAFYLSDIDYRWNSGRLERLNRNAVLEAQDLASPAYEGACQ